MEKIEKIEKLEEVYAIPLDLPEKEYIELAKVEVPKERELTIEEIGTLTTAEFEEIEIERSGVDVKVGVKLPHIPSPLQVGKTYAIGTEHWVRVKNNSNHVVQDWARFEWRIHGVYKAWASKEIYVKRGNEKYVPYTMPKRTFSFKTAGKYHLFGYTRFLGEERTVDSGEFVVNEK